MDVVVLGPLRLGIAGSLRPIEAPKQRMIFGVLLVHTGEVVGAERLLHEAWDGRPPAAGVQALRYHLSKLRDVLVPGRDRGDEGPIRTVGSGYRLVVTPGEIDADRFGRLADRGARLVENRDWDRALGVFDEALGLWRGDAWEDFRYADFAQPTIRALEERRLVCVEDRVDARLGRGEHQDLVAELDELTSRHPLRERLWAQSMVALYRAGRGAEAAGVYETARRVLGEQLGVDPNPSLQRLHQRVVEQSLPVAGPERGAPGRPGLPLRSSTFIGRTRELDEVADLLGRRRLVTVTGPGGVGKTSVALEAARHTSDGIRRIVFVDLASLDRPAQVVPQIVRSFGVVGVAGRATIDDVIGQVGDDACVVVIDNCEHVAGAVADGLSTLLGNCPNLTVLATSRQPLHVDGEHVYVLDPLTVPDDPAARTVDDSDAVRLFVDRAAAARGDFSIDDRNRDQVVGVCRRLDGLPLALELAASRLRVLAIDEVLERLTRPLDLLVDQHRDQPRHRALRATIEWSHDLLSDEAKGLLRRLAVFRGRFDVSSVAAVCSDQAAADARVLDVVGELVDNSFVIRRDDEQGGLVMLDTIREYALDQLKHAGEAQDIRTRHARWYADRTTAQPAHGSLEDLAQARRMRFDRTNHTAALDWALRSGRHELATRLAAGVALYWYAGAGGTDDLRGLVTSLLDRGEAGSAHAADALVPLGLTLCWMGCRRDAERVAEELTRLADKSTIPIHRANALWVQGAIATVAGDIRQSRGLFRQGVTLLRPTQHPNLSIFLFALAHRELILGNPARAVTLAGEMADLGDRLQQPLTTSRVVLLRGLESYHRGDLTGAVSDITQALGTMRQLGVVGPQAEPLRALCDAASMAQQWDLAETAARELRVLLASNGEIIRRPVADNTLATVALAQGDPAAAARHVRAGLAVITRTRTVYALDLDHSLLTAARVARALDRPDMALRLYLGREQRLRKTGLVDPLPVTRLVDRETTSLSTQDMTNRRRSDGAAPTDKQSLVHLALDAIAT